MRLEKGLKAPPIDNHRCTSYEMLPFISELHYFFPLIVEGTNCAGGLYKLIQKNCLESSYKVDF